MKNSGSDGQFSVLLRALAKGEADARNQIISYCQERLKVRVRQMLPGFPTVQRNEETSDVLQKVLLDLSETLTTVAPNDSRHFLCLASQQIRRTLLDLARKYRNRGNVTLAEALPPAEAPTQFDPIGPFHDPVTLELWTEIHEYLQGLPNEERELFDLLFYQDVPQEAAAEILGVSYRTLKRRWLEARLRFMEKFGKDLLP